MKLSSQNSCYYILCMLSCMTGSYLHADKDCCGSADVCQTGSVKVPRAIRPKICCNDACDLLCSTGPYPCGTSIYIPRSQGDNTARELVGWQPFLYQYNVDQNYTCFALVPEFTKSTHAPQIANSLFCSSCLTFAGSLFPDRKNGSEIIGDNFGLSPFFKGSLKIAPKIENYILDLNIYFGLDEWLSGLFLKIHAPITHTKWNLGLDECSPCENLLTSTNCELLLTSTSAALCFETPACSTSGVVSPFTPSIMYPSLRVVLSGDFLFGDMKTPWEFGRFDFCAQEVTKLADLDLMLGYNFISTPWSNFAVYLKGVVPTGTHVRSFTVFEPVVGNGRHWELGAGFAAHVNLLGDPCSSYQTLGLYAEGNITHMFTAHQKRSFDFLRNGLLSRYLLLKEFAADNITYTGNLINAINFNTRSALVDVQVKGDLSVKLAYRNDSWTVDIGYNIFGQSHERVCIKTDCPCDIDRRRFGIKGTAGVCAREYMVVTEGVLGSLIASLPLNATQSTATLFSPGPIDNPAPMQPVMPGDIILSSASLQAPGTPISATIPAVQSAPPVLVHCHDLDPNSAAQCSILTHKFFTHIGYIWFDTCWQPFVGIGGEIEIKSKKHNGLNQWGVWFKGGLNF